MECPVPMPPFRKVESVVLEKAHTAAPCVEGKTYELNGNSITVKEGCTATFAAQVVIDAERCAVERSELEADCGKMTKEMEMCGVELEAVCGALPKGSPKHPFGGALVDPRQRPVGSRDKPEGKGRRRDMGPQGNWHHGNRHGWGMGEDPYIHQLRTCVQENADAFSPECRETKLVRRLSHHCPMGFVRWIIIGSIIVASLVFAAIGGVFFLWRRRQLSATRGPAAEKLGSWSTGLFAFDWSSCLPSLCCPWFQSALNQAEVHDRDGSVADVCMNAHHYSLVSNTYHTRQAIRHKFEIPEEPVKDCLTAAFCLPCAMAQNTRELDVRRSRDAVIQGQLDTSKTVEGMPVKEVSMV